jgi:hypothetical protein
MLRNSKNIQRLLEIFLRNMNFLHTFIRKKKTTFSERGQSRFMGLPVKKLMTIFPRLSPQLKKGIIMSRFKKMSHTIWHCTYHIVWTPKYRYRILKGEIKEEVEHCIRSFSKQKECLVEELP